MQVLLRQCASKDSRSHEELDLSEAHVSELVVPTKEFLVCFIEIQIGFVN